MKMWLQKMSNMKKIIKIAKKVLVILLAIVFLAISVVLGLNFYVKNQGSKSIITLEQAIQMDDVDCVLILGCQVKSNGVPSDMLRDRLNKGIEIYKNSVGSTKLLMSGDHGTKWYNEVGTMEQYALDTGVPADDIFTDHAGFSTYESVYRAKEIFCAEKIIIVTQEYHLYRALYIAEQLGVEAYGVTTDPITYAGQYVRDLREVLARCKDFVTTVYKPEPTYLGEKIPIN